MAWIANWLADQQQHGMAQLVVDETLWNLKKRSKILDKYIPFETYESRDFLGYIVDRIETVASVIAYGSEPPATQHGRFRELTGQLMKTGLSFIYDENKQWQMKEAMEKAQRNNIRVQTVRDPYTGQLIKGANEDLAMYLFGTIEQIARAQVELLDVMTWEVLQTGKVSRTDPRTGLTTSLDYRDGVDNSYDHFPSPLVGDDRWDQYATADGLGVLFRACNDYVTVNGFYPEAVVMGRTLINDLLQQTSTKEAVVMKTTTQVGSVSVDMLAEILKARNLPPIVPFDEMYKNELADKTTVNTRFLNDNRFVFLNNDMGKRAMGPTLENDGETGVYVVTREIEPVPPVDATQGVATVLPVIVEPKLLYSQQVKDAV
jgi:hypothetical protein